jgi:hypothetical protein
MVFYCVNFLGTPPEGVAEQTLPLARYRAPKVPVTPMASIILVGPMSMKPNPSVVAAQGILAANIRASPDSGTPRQGFCKALLPVVESF